MPHAEGIEHGDDIDRLLDQRSQRRREQPRRRESHPHEARGHTADGGLQRDRAEALADVEELVDALKRRIHDDGAGRLAGDVVGGPHRDPDGGRRQRRRIVDPITDKQRWRFPGRLLDDPQLPLRGDAGVDLRDPNPIRQPPHLALPVARDEHHALEPVSRPEVLDEGGAILPGAVAEAEQADGPALDDDDTLQASGGGR